MISTGYRPCRLQAGPVAGSCCDSWEGSFSGVDQYGFEFAHRYQIRPVGFGQFQAQVTSRSEPLFAAEVAYDCLGFFEVEELQGHPVFAVVRHFDPARFEVGDIAVVAARELHAGIVANFAQVPVDRHGKRLDVALADIVVAVLEFGRYVAVDRQFGAAAGVPRAACHEDPFAAVGEEGIERDVVEHGVVRSDLEFGVAFQLYGQRVEAVGRQLRLVDLEMRHGLALAHFER